MRCFGFTLLLLPLVSCGGSGSIQKVTIDPEAASAKAFELFDKNSDGFIDDAEVQSAPGLAEGMVRVDANSDGKISPEEITDRINSWNESVLSLVSPELVLKFNGRIVPGALITFEPEPFLAEWLEEKRVWSNQFGTVTPQISRELPGMYMGYYRVKVSKEMGGKERIPPEYNEQTQLGVEFCTDRPIEENFLIELNLGKSSRRR